MKQDRTDLHDEELNRLLAFASSPPAPLGAEARLLKRLAAVETAPFPRAQNSGRKYWLAGLPLAASLALGLYIGASGTSLMTAEDADIASLEEVWGTGLEDAELAAEEDQS